MAATPLALRRSASRGRAAESAFHILALSAAAALLVVIALMVFKLGQESGPAWRARSGGLLTGTRWAPSEGHFGGLPFLYGTLVTSAIGLVLAVPVALATALFISEMASARMRRIVAPLVDLLAAVPSVVYGLWG